MAATRRPSLRSGRESTSRSARGGSRPDGTLSKDELRQIMASFETGYRHQCRKFGIGRPETSVTRSVKEGGLELNVERLTLSQWEPIWAAMKSNRDLKSIRVFAGSTLSLVSSGTSSKKASAYTGPRGGARNSKRKERGPVTKGQVMDGRTSFQLAKALGLLLIRTESLASLSLTGLWFGPESLKWLAKGLRDHRGTTLTKLSFEGTNLGDDGLATLLPGLKGLPSLAELNLAGTGLGAKSGPGIGRIVQAHAERRHEAIWAAGLRGRSPEKAELTGLLSLNLARNELTNSVAVGLASALRNDEWVTSIDLSANKGLTPSGVAEFLDLLSAGDNTTLVELDLRDIPDLNFGDVAKLQAILLERSGAELEQVGTALSASSGSAGRSSGKRVAWAEPVSEAAEAESGRSSDSKTVAVLRAALEAERTARRELESRLKAALHYNTQLKDQLVSYQGRMKSVTEQFTEYVQAQSQSSIDTSGPLASSMDSSDDDKGPPVSVPAKEPLAEPDDVIGVLESSLASFHNFIDELEVQLYVDGGAGKSSIRRDLPESAVTEAMLTKLQESWGLPGSKKQQ